jgi:hypothetical protein
MKNLIHKLKERIPLSSPEFPVKEDYRLYRLLNHYANYCAQKWETPETKVILALVNEDYQRDNVFTRNAIENEFLAVEARQLDNTHLMLHLTSMPELLKPVYLKVLIETKKPPQK